MPFFPNTLELERRLCALGAHQVVLEEPFELLERFKMRFRDENYMLMAQEQIDAAKLSETLASVAGLPNRGVQFLTNAECRRMPREEQSRIYKLALSHSLRVHLDTEAFRQFAQARSDGRKMLDVIKGAIGTRLLTPALDRTFGNSFASIMKRDITAAWATYFMSLVPEPGRLVINERVTSARKDLVLFLTQTVPGPRLPENPEVWLAFVA